MEQEYINLRNRYLPEKLKVVFVLESPPQGHGYFYDPNGKVSEILFRSFMKFINFVPNNKDEGLKELAGRGYVLTNPIYIPVNKLPDKEADKMILDNYRNFLVDLDFILKKNKTVPIVLVKSNILRLLEQPMLSDGYNIINNGILIPFPLHYHVETFQKRLKELIYS